jgi:DNA-binding LacI/PurR family transcriptional regulator
MSTSAPAEKPLAESPRATDPPKRLQMADIARLAGVSASTVSRALSGHPAIPESTRARITELARSLNYQVNVGAANLRRRGIQTVAVAMQTDTLQGISDPFILSLLGSIADALDRRGLSLLLTRSRTEQPESLAQMVDNGQASGLIVIGQYAQQDRLNLLTLRRIPLVVWGAHLPTMLYPVVGGDNELGGHLAARHLLDRGCRRVGFVGEFNHPEAMLRHQGYVRALAEAGLPADPRLHIDTPFEPEHTRLRMRQWLQTRPEFDGLCCVSDVMAINVIAVLQEHGIRVPNDVRVTGYDDVPLAAHVHPSITTIRQPTADAGESLVSSLMDVLEGRLPERVILPTELIGRESSA